MWKRPACQILSKALDISSVTAQVFPDLLKALAILSDTTVGRWKSEKGRISLDDEESYCLQFLSKTLLTIKRRLTGYIFKDILKYRDHQLELPIIMKSWLLQTHIHWRFQLVCMKVQAHSSLEPPLEYNQGQKPLRNQDLLGSF